MSKNVHIIQKQRYEIRTDEQRTLWIFKTGSEKLIRIIFCQY
jgi:hypothetical protein